MSQVVEVMKPGEAQLLRQLLYLMSGVGAKSQAKPNGRWLPTFGGNQKQRRQKAEDVASLCKLDNKRLKGWLARLGGGA